MMEFVWMFLVGLLAFSTGRNTLLWTAAAYIFGWPTLVVLVFLPKNEKSEEKAKKRLDFINNKTEEVNAQNQLKDVNTVDDLFKQLETK